MHPLDAPRLKLRRAEQHLNTIEVMINNFITSNPYTFTIEANPKLPNYAILVRINHLPNEEWGLVIGDFAHNARSALDLLIFQLSTLPADDPKRKHIEFPIFKCSEKYTKGVVNDLAGVSSEDRKIIEDFQPYKKAEGFYDDALWILHSINNTDKHQIIHSIGSVGHFKNLGLGFGGSGVIGGNVIRGDMPIVIEQNSTINFGDEFIYSGFGDGTIVKDRTIVGKIFAKSGIPKQMNMYPEAEIIIKFDKGSCWVQGRPVMKTLTFIHDRVKEIIGKFDARFPK